MAAALTLGLYGTPESPNEDHPLGIRGYQHIPGRPLLPHSGWFNHRGERLGNGDLDICHLATIAANCPEGEYFLVLREAHSHWWLTRQDEGVEQASRLFNSDYDTPGREYVGRLAEYAVTQSRIYRVLDAHLDANHVTEMYEAEGVVFHYISREQLVAMLAELDC